MKKYHIITYGCQMNKSDSERLAAKMEKKGYRPALKIEQADLIVINACSVRQSAINRVYGKINNLCKQPAHNATHSVAGRKKIILTGCILPADRKKLEPLVDEIWPFTELNIQPKCQTKNFAFLPIMTGCNNFCSYCAVPYTRGREISRSAEEIIKEAKRLIKAGYKEIILLGQNVNSYKSEKTNFPQLLKSIADMPGDFALKFITSHPKDLSDDLIKIMANSEKIAKEIHLPIQSGDNQILKKMNRGYTTAHYKNLIKKLRQAIPEIKISTDIIVGFPSETKKQFQNTVKLCKAIKFNKAYIAQYSPRQGTTAAKLPDNISHQEKKQRWQILENFINK